jgi:hypothetical protein
VAVGFIGGRNQNPPKKNPKQNKRTATTKNNKNPHTPNAKSLTNSLASCDGQESNSQL